MVLKLFKEKLILVRSKPGAFKGFGSGDTGIILFNAVGTHTY
jgi:hypothetical protein